MIKYKSCRLIHDFLKIFDVLLLPKGHHQNYWKFLQVSNICFKNWYNSTTIHLLSVSIFHNNMPIRTKSINKGLSQKVLTEMTWWFFWTGACNIYSINFLQRGLSKWTKWIRGGLYCIVGSRRKEQSIKWFYFICFKTKLSIIDMALGLRLSFSKV